MIRLCENNTASATPLATASTKASKVMRSVVHSDAISDGKSPISACQIADGAGSTKRGMS